MLGYKFWLTVGAPVHPKGVGGVEVKDLCKLVKFFDRKLEKKTFLYGAGFMLWLHQTLATKLATHYCLLSTVAALKFMLR